VEDLQEVPFERQATLILASACAAARLAAEQAGLGGGLQPFIDAGPQGISANLCDTLAGLVHGEEITGLDLQFAWAASRLPPAGTPTAVHIGADLSPILREGARLLRASGTTPDFELEGTMVKLESEDAAAGGVAVIAGQVDGRPRRVRVPMTAADYTSAIRAHQQYRLVHCEGELVRQGRGFQLERARHVALVEDED
jgi:hypothetical protein